MYIEKDMMDASKFIHVQFKALDDKYLVCLAGLVSFSSIVRSFFKVAPRNTWNKAEVMGCHRRTVQSGG